MNKIFKTVWNRVRRCYVAVNETVTSARQATGTVMTAVGLMAIVSAQPAIATEVNSSNNISGNLTYNDVVFQGAGSSEKDVWLTTEYFRKNIAEGKDIGDWTYTTPQWGGLLDRRFYDRIPISRLGFEHPAR